HHIILYVAAPCYYTLKPTNRYDPKVYIFVIPSDPTDETFLGSCLLRESPSAPNRGVSTAARFVKTQQVAEAVRARLASGRNGAPSTSALLSKVQAAPVGQANIVAISATGESAKRAAETANAF